MTAAVARLRMFAGPNGSGKSSIYDVLPQELRGVYVNADDIEREVAARGELDLQAYGVHTTGAEIAAFFRTSPLLARAGLLDDAAALRCVDGRIDFQGARVNSYLAAVAADFIRRALLDAHVSLTFETVMSSRDKVELLAEARARGYRTYLYYVATDDPEINVTRVHQRVAAGGHPVPEDKIVSRYHRSLELLPEAVRASDRAYLFDNSGSARLWVAEVTAGRRIELRTDVLPGWFRRSLWDRALAADPASAP